MKNLLKLHHREFWRHLANFGFQRRGGILRWSVCWNQCGQYQLNAEFFPDSQGNNLCGGLKGKMFKITGMITVLQSYTLVNPYLGVEMCNGVCPPVIPLGIPGPLLDFCPAAPRPQNLPPCALPRPTRFFFELDPGAGDKSPKWRQRRKDDIINLNGFGFLNILQGRHLAVELYYTNLFLYLFLY